MMQVGGLPVPMNAQVVGFGSGNWYFTSQFSSTDNGCVFRTGTAIIEGATDSSVTPFFVRTRTNTACANGNDGYIQHNGGQRTILSSDGIFTFEFRYD